MITARPELILHGGTVRRVVLQAVQFQQDLHDFLHRIFNIVGILVKALAGRRSFRQYISRRRIQCLLILFPGDELVFIHTPQHIVRPVVGHRFEIPVLALAGVEIPPRIVIVRVVCRSGQHGAFPDRQIPQVLAEIALRRHLHAIIVLSQIDRVQIAFKDLILRVAFFQLQR